MALEVPSTLIQNKLYRYILLFLMEKDALTVEKLLKMKVLMITVMEMNVLLEDVLAIEVLMDMNALIVEALMKMDALK